MKQISQKWVLELLKEYKIKTPKTLLVKEKSEIDGLAMRFPVVLKVDSKDVLHKSDQGYVQTDIQSRYELINKFHNMWFRLNNKGYLVNNFIIQEQIHGIEVIIGMKRTPDFGPVVMFGLGGIYVELLKDISFRVLPITLPDAHEMIDEIKGSTILKGLRGNNPVNTKLLAEIIMKTATIAEKYPEIQEIDFNPVIINSDNAFVVDARILRGEEN